MAGRERLTSDDVIEVARQLGGMAEAGLALPPGLRALAEELPGSPLRRALVGLAVSIEGGDTLDEAIAAQGSGFPMHLGGLVRAGARTGRLPEVLGRYVELERAGLELRRRLWINLAYPVVLLMGLVGVMVLISLLIVGGFEQIMKDFGVDLPILTIFLIRVSHVFHGAGWGAVLAPAVALAALWFLGKALPNGPWRRRVTSQVPLVGPLWRWTALAEFSHLLGLLLEADLPLVEAVPLAAEGVRDADLAEVARRMAAELAAGAPLAESLTRWRVYPAGFARLFDWSQSSRSLAEALHMAGETFAARARAQAAFVGVFVTVLVITFVILGIIVVVLGLYLPFINLISRLSG